MALALSSTTAPGVCARGIVTTHEPHAPSTHPASRAIFLSGNDAQPPRVAGLTPIQRTRRALEGIPSGDEVSSEGGVVLFLATDALVEPNAISALLAGSRCGAATVAAEDDPRRPAALALCACDERAHLLTSTEALTDCVTAARDAGTLHTIAVGDDVCRRISDRATAERAEAILLARLIRPTDGFLARYFDRHLSRRLSVRLVERDVAPNTVTIVATLVGLVGAGLLAQLHHGARVFGATLLVISTILDGCDGEVARLSLRCSELGRRLDLLGDNVVNAAVFAAMAIALERGADGGIPPGLAPLTAIAFVVATCTGFVFSKWLARTNRTLERDWYERLTGRDFAYVILLLAIAGRLHWFLWMAMVGCFAFSASVLAYWTRLAWGPQAVGARS
jgi:phosphatidylglycerophosphate synthase